MGGWCCAVSLSSTRGDPLRTAGNKLTTGAVECEVPRTVLSSSLDTRMFS